MFECARSQGRGTRYRTCVAYGDPSTSTGSQPRLGHARGKDALARAERHRDDVEDDLVDLPGLQGLADGRRAARDADVTCTRLTRQSQPFGEALGDEVERRPALPSRSGSRVWWVSTKTSVWYGGSSPHQPRHWSVGPSPPGRGRTCSAP